VTVLGAVRQRTGALLALLAILVISGTCATVRLPASIFPSVTFPIVKVISDVGEAPAIQIMPSVTRPLEEAILRVPGIERLRSTTSRGSSELSAHFAWGTDMQAALQRVQAETQRIRSTLPADTHIDVEWMNASVFPILGYALTSDSLSQAELWDLAEYTLKPALIRIHGVSQVQIEGGRRREFQVLLDPHALQGRGLSAADVVRTLRASNLMLSAGLTERNHELYLSLIDGRVRGFDDLSRFSVPVRGGPPVELSSLGEIRVADQVAYTLATANGSEAVLVNIVREPAGNTVAIAKGVRALIRDRRVALPPAARWTRVYDQARFVSDSLRGACDAIAIGMLLAALVLYTFLRELRPTLIAVAALPIALSIVGLVFGFAGVTLNLMTLAGVAASLGLIADDAIVVVEEIEHASASGRAPWAAVRRLLPALIGSSLSTTVILLPFVVLPGVTGAFFKPLALTMALALGASFVVAALVLPVAAARFGTGVRKRAAPAPPPQRGRGCLTRRSARTYEALTAFCVKQGAVAALVLATLIVLGGVGYRAVGTDFLPSMDEGSIVLDYWTPPGTSLTDTDAMLREVERVIGTVPDIAGYSRRTGTQLGFFITEPNSGDFVINLKPRGERRGYDEIVEELRARIEAVEPAIHAEFGQLLEDQIGDLTGGEPQPIDVKLMGSDTGLLEARARQVARILREVPGVDDVFDGVVIAGPALQVRVQPEAAARYGLTTTDLHAQIEPSLAGSVAGHVPIGDRRYDVRVFENSAGELGDVSIRAGGALLRLRDLAEISTGPAEAEINREDLKTYVGVTARLAGRDLGSAMAEIRSRIEREVALGPGMSIEYGGQYAQQQRSFADLLLVLLAGLVLVCVVVLFEFGDWRAPLVTCVCALAVLPGVLGALTLAGMTLNISSYVGAIMMVGIVGENAIFVIHEAREGLAHGLAVEAAWIAASRRRLRPVAMTVLATSLALAPLAIAIGSGAQLVQPLAVAVIGGLALSGPIVLLLLPGIYRLLDPRGELGGLRSASPRES
jgi:CzcA family heavy metal efflux pump